MAEPATGSAVRISSFPAVLASNPYQRLLYEHLEDAGFSLAEGPGVDHGWLRVRWLARHRSAIDVLHIHWPQGLWRVERGPGAVRRPLSWVKLGSLGLRLALARRLGYRLAWTIHQVEPHESRGSLDRIGARLLARHCDVLLAHDEETAADARARLGPRAQAVAVVPHGSYLGVYPPGRPAHDVRAELGLAASTFTFLCFGEVRAYKGIERVIAAFRAAALPDAALVIAGRVGDARVGAAVEAAAQADARIKPLLGFVPDARVAEIFGACDAAVIGRRPGTSGSLVLSLSLGLPTVAPRTEGYAELLDAGRAGWLFDVDDPAALPAALEAAASDRADAHRRADAAVRQAAELDWGLIAARTAGLLRPGHGRLAALAAAPLPSAAEG